MEERMYNKNKTTNYIVMVLFLAIVSGLLVYTFYLKSQLNLLDGNNTNFSLVDKPVLDFMDSFIEIVLKAEGEVNFENRLKLENQVRDLDDEEILSKWQNFVNSNTEVEAQEHVLNLIDILVKKLASK